MNMIKLVVGQSIPANRHRNTTAVEAQGETLKRDDRHHTAFAGAPRELSIYAPERAKELAELFEKEAKRTLIYPLPGKRKK